jgi:hypothetical protein
MIRLAAENGLVVRVGHPAGFEKDRQSNGGLEETLTGG